MRYLFMRQWTGHTCAPTTLRICALAFLQKTYSEKMASSLCNTTIDGTSWRSLKSGFKKAGLRTIKIVKHSKKEWNAWLDAGYFIVAADELTYTESHVIVVHKNSAKTYGVVDPINGFPTYRNKDRVIKSAQREAFAVCAI